MIFSKYSKKNTHKKQRVLQGIQVFISVYKKVWMTRSGVDSAKKHKNNNFDV